jgi:hypothetical protein
MNVDVVRLISGGLLAIGLVGLFGVYRGWTWLVDPPSRLWPIYVPSLVKHLFGARVLRVTLWVVFVWGIITTAIFAAGF